ncbi:DUF445 family protein [Halanaerobium sp. Z-7514]|uniref:DUF445 family protein n=1 Tax=Halanaerobium polyolivorans TaxID=2886943 RepID=A0AAW4X2F8_9FIRM|nr:DUF445 family protein [Halanaerobium polyolivorans]MCC3145990.1 DUF445 family protein [Halanaerobium polyolivorans]
MFLDIPAILAAASTGAVTGYLTNNLALKMIFKKYGPFGGVVIKTRDEFIESISELVERDIINHATLKEEFSKPEFKKNLNKTVKDLLKFHLYQRSKAEKLAEFPAWEKNYQLSTKYLAERLAQYFDNLSLELGKNYQMVDLIDEKGLTEIIENFYFDFIEAVESNKLFKKILFDIYVEIKNKKLSTLLTEESKAELSDFLKTFAAEINRAYSSEEDKAALKASLNNLLNLEKISSSLIEKIKKIKIEELFKAEASLEEFRRKDEFQNIIKGIIANFKVEIENSDLKIADLISPQLEKNIEEDLKLILIQSKAEIINFIRANEAEIEEFIFRAVEEEIELSSGFKAMSRSAIYNKYQENIDEYGRPVDLIINYLNDSLSKENNDLINKILNQIKTKNIALLSSFIKTDITAKKIEAYFFNFLKENKAKSLEDIFSQDFFDNQNLESKLFELLFVFIQNTLSDQELLELFIENIFDLPLERLIKTEHFSQKAAFLEKILLDNLKNNSLFIELLFNYINNNALVDLNKYIKNNPNNISEQLENKFLDLESEIGSKELRDLYKNFTKDKKNILKLSDELCAFLYNYLPEVVEGSIAQTASANLKQLSDQEVQTAIEEFIGKELKPITYLGALLGAAAGVIFNLTGAESALMAASPVWVDYLSSALLYGSVGWLTNVLAIWMIFNPYQEKYIASFKVPFTPGVVAKNRNRFADSMGSFVEKELLKANSAADLIENNRKEITDKGLQFFKDQDYQLLFNLLKKKDSLIADALLNFSAEQISEAKTKIYLQKYINSMLNDILENEIKAINLEKISSEILDHNREKINFSTAQLGQDLFSVEKLANALAGEYTLSLSSNRFKEIISDKKIFPFAKYLLPQLFKLDLRLDLNDLLFPYLVENKTGLIEAAKGLLYEQEENILQKLKFKKDELIELEKSKEGGLLKNTIISGAILMADLDGFIDSVGRKIFNQFLPEFLEDKDQELKSYLEKHLNNLREEELASLSSFNFSASAEYFFASDKGEKFLNDLIFLNETEIEKLAQNLLKAENKELFNFNFEVNKLELEKFIKNQFSLEQKLKLLVDLKNIFSEQKIKKEIKYLINNEQLAKAEERWGAFAAELSLANKNYISSQAIAKITDNLSSSLEKDDFYNNVHAETKDLVVDFINYLEKEMDRESLNYLLELFLQSGIDSLIVNSEEIVESLELKELTAAEIRKMDPAEIESTFNSFAGHYFNQLKQYGWFGGIFGLLQLLLRTFIL